MAKDISNTRRKYCKRQNGLLRHIKSFNKSRSSVLSVNEAKKSEVGKEGIRKNLERCKSFFKSPSSYRKSIAFINKYRILRLTAKKSNTFTRNLSFKNNSNIPSFCYDPLLDKPCFLVSAAQIYRRKKNNRFLQVPTQSKAEEAKKFHIRINMKKLIPLKAESHK